MSNPEKPSSSTNDSGDGSFFKNNGGLLIGGAMAMFALFGMEGSFLPSLIAGAALIMGFLADKDSGVFGGVYSKIFGKEEASQPSTEISKSQAKTTGVGTNEHTVAKPAPTVESTPSIAVPPTAPEPAAQSQGDGSKIKSVNNPSKNSFSLGVGETPVYFNNNGEKVYNIKGIPSAMEIKVDKEGKATGVAVANEKGHFDRDGKGEIILTKPQEEVTFNLTQDNKGVKHVDLADKENKEKLGKLREIGIDELNKRVMQKQYEKGSSLPTDAGVATSDLGVISPSSQVVAKNVGDKTSYIG